LHARTDALYDTERGVAVIHREASDTARGEIRPLGGNGGVEFASATNAKLAEVRPAAARMSAVAEDVLDVSLSNAIDNPTDTEG